MLIHDYSHLPFVQRVDVLEEGGSITADELVTKYGNRPLLLKQTAVAASAADWSDVFEALAEMKCVMAAPVDVAGRTYVFKSSVTLRDFMREAEAREGVYLSEWYLFERAPELIDQLTSELPDALLDDWLDIMPRSWRFMSAPTRTNVYYGAHGSRTRVHVDSMNTTTWNMCLNGTKRWLMFSCQDSQSSQARLGGGGHEALQSFLKQDDPWELVTAEALTKYRDTASNAPTFFTVDVEAGSTLWVPWGWAHQVQNIGASLAVSRYLVGPSNFEAFFHGSKKLLGKLSPHLLRTLLGGARRRALLKIPAVRRILSRRVPSRICHAALRLGSLVSAETHWFREVPG
jgi:hypothetical protein